MTLISVCGQIRKINLDERIFEIKIKNRIEFFYFSRSQYKRFKPYLHEGLYVFFLCKEERTIKCHRSTREVISFTKMIRHTSKGFMTYYDIDMIKSL